MPGSPVRRAPWRRGGALALVIAAGFAAARPEAVCAQRGAIPAGPIEIVLDASGSMRGRLGDSDRMTVAHAFVRALRTSLADGGAAPPIALRVYGADTHRLEKNCRDTRLAASFGAPPAGFDAALAAVRPNGVSPLAWALAVGARDTARTYVVIADGGDNCGRDPCAAWRRVTAGGNRRARLHVVAIAPEAEEVDGLLCLSRAGSGTFIEIDDPAEAAAAAERLARILKNTGLVDVRLTVGDGERIVAPVRLVRPLTGEAIAVFNSRAPREVPAGVYNVIVETSPALTVERALVLPGETLLVERSDFGRLLVELRGSPGTARAPVSLRAAAGGPELRYVRTGEAAVLRAGAYDVVVDLGDSVVTRDAVTVSRGRTTRVVVGGSDPGRLLVVAPEFERPPPTRALAMREGRVDTLAVGEHGRLAPGVYRLVVQTFPPYVTENVRVESGADATVVLPQTGVLRVDVIGPDGPIRGVPVEMREPMTGEPYGTLSSGEPRLVMPGRFALEVRAAPPIAIPDVPVPPGEETVVERRVPARVTLTGTPDRPVTLQLWTGEPGPRRLLAEATGTPPSIAAAAGTYAARLLRDGTPVWEGRVAVAAGRTARIDWPRP